MGKKRKILITAGGTGSGWRISKTVKQFFPEDVELLRSFPILAIDDFDLSTLSDRQRTAFDQWLRQGGIVLSGGGSSGISTFRGLMGYTGIVTGTPTRAERVDKALISGLSQGQRQLISIARAAVADPPCMILDEATSSIDTRTESIVQKGMDNLMKGRTVFVIAHRLSTVQNADVIMVMENGRIIERGNHDRLMEKKGRYYRLYTGVTE